MSDTPTVDPTTASPDEPSESAPPPATNDPLESRIAEVRAARRRRAMAPMVTMSVDVPTEADTWETVETGELIAGWNARYRSRPDYVIRARQMPGEFTYETPDYQTFVGKRDDWLIREEESGEVFGVTDRAFKALFEPEEQPAAAPEPPTDQV